MKNNIISENFVVETRKLFQAGLIRNPNDEIAEEVLRETLMIERNSSEYVFYEDPVLDLIKNYNLETFDIGRIHFYSDEELESNENFIIVGFDGAGEFIAIDKHSKKIYSIDGYFEVISFCSNSSEEFLNNLIKIGEAYIKRWTQEERLKLAKSMGDNTSLGFYADALDAY
jgi:hypothetical protein